MTAFSFTKAWQQRILPAITFSSSEDALPVAEAVVKSGLRVMEIPFRTASAGKAVTAIRSISPELCVGAGTLLTIAQLLKAIQAGAQFGLSPGFNPTIYKEAHQAGFPFIPGVMTPSEIECAAEMGYTVLKLFP